MEYETIKMIARSTEILCHFTQMYNQSIHLLKSIPDEEMNKVLLKKWGKKEVGADKCDNFEIAYINAFTFQNVIDEKKGRCLDKVWLAVEIMSVEEKFDNISFSEEYVWEIDCLFDYWFFGMKLLVGKDEVMFWPETFGVEEDLTREQRLLLKAMKNPMFLERVFGEHLIKVTESYFIVSEKCFKK